MDVSHRELLSVRLRYEEAISRCSRVLLDIPSNAIQTVLRILLEASDVDRVYIFENSYDSDGFVCMSQTYEACDPSTPAQVDNPDLTGLRYSEGFSRWEKELSAGNNIAGAIETFPATEREILKPQGILTILILPIHNANGWFGFIGFDDTTTVRPWSYEDVRLLRTAAEIIGAYFARIENERRLTESVRKLSQSNATKDRLISIISHDLRSPLISLHSALRVAAQDEKSLPQAEFNAKLAELQRSLHGAIDHLDTVLKWSIFQRDRIVAHKQMVVLASAVERAATVHAESMKDKRISFDVSIDESVVVFADDVMVRLIFQNLIGNAVKFCRIGGRVSIRAEYEEDGVVTSVSDDGVGMDNETASKLFSDEHIVSSEGTIGERGTGIGLLLCRDLIHANDGSIWVSSASGKGSTFTFRLPAAAYSRVSDADR